MLVLKIYRRGPKRRWYTGLLFEFAVSRAKLIETVSEGDRF